MIGHYWTERHGGGDAGGLRSHGQPERSRRLFQRETSVLTCSVFDAISFSSKDTQIDQI